MQKQEQVEQFELTSEQVEKRRKAQTDLYWFAGTVLKYQQLYEPLHRAMARFWQDPRPLKLGMWPRDHFKSTLFSICAPLWEVIRCLDPKVAICPPPIPMQILLAGENEKIPVKFLRAIAWHIGANEDFQHLFPEIQRGQPWSMKEAANLRRAFDPVLKESTFEVMGGKGNPTSPHYNLIIEDDTIGFANYKTQEGRDGAWDWHVACTPLMLPDAKRVVVCTRWDPDDVAGRIIDQNDEVPEEYQYYIENHSCYNEEGEPIFPTRWPKPKLEATKIECGEVMFANWYLNDPVSSRFSQFAKEWLKYWTLTKEMRERIKDMACAIIVDPNSEGEAPTADFSACMVVGIDGDNRYVLNTFQAKINWNQLVGWVRNWCRVYHPFRLAIEAQSTQKPIMNLFEAEWRKGNMPQPIRLQTSTGVRGGRGVGKHLRFSALAPYLENNQIYVNREQTTLIKQILGYPKIKHDDLLDCLSRIPEVLPFGAEGFARPGLEAKSKAFPRSRIPGQIVVGEPPDGAVRDNFTWGWM